MADERNTGLSAVVPEISEKGLNVELSGQGTLFHLDNHFSRIYGPVGTRFGRGREAEAVRTDSALHRASQPILSRAGHDAARRGGIGQGRMSINGVREQCVVPASEQCPGFSHDIKFRYGK